MFTGKSVVNVYAIVEVIVYVSGCESDVISKHSIIVLIDVSTLECRSILVVAVLARLISITLTAEVFGCGESKSNRTAVHFGFELDVLAEFKLESVVSKQGLEYVGKATVVASKVNVCIEIEVNIFFLKFEVNYVDVEHLTAG